MSEQKVYVDKYHFLEWRFANNDDVEFIGEQVIEQLKSNGKYSTDIYQLLLLNTNYIPMHCITNWDSLILPKIDMEEEELPIDEDRFEFIFDEENESEQ
tara:strand:+ start:376 stop:672 length:297 start_codon:yes stop_codon:yes gene_type:complete